jgi:hypothetical protein
MVNRHAHLACTLGPALPIFPLPVSMIEPSFRTLLVAAIGATAQFHSLDAIRHS